MPDQQEAQRVGREAGEAIANAIADNLESVILKLADSISKLQAEQERQADQVATLAQRVETHSAGIASLNAATETLQGILGHR
jgi:hypothetical protein